MPSELLFTVHGSKAAPAVALSLADAGLKERGDLQEWVAGHPEILGPEIMVVTMEFDRWQSAGAKNADRLDILGLHTSGELVVVELKRDKAPDTVEMQAIKYAAMASRFTLETLAEQHARYLTQRGKPTDEDAAGDLLAKHANITTESLRRPRIVLLASDYPPTTSAAAVWLSEMGIDITLMQYRA
jgi:RecB family endonuclease NucS